MYYLKSYIGFKIYNHFFCSNRPKSYLIFEKLSSDTQNGRNTIIFDFCVSCKSEIYNKKNLTAYGYYWETLYKIKPIECDF